MKVYDSYAEAKIANPDSDIYERMCVDFATADYVSLVRMCGTGDGWNKCHPAYYCMTVEKFQADGHSFVEGDICMNTDASVVTIKHVNEWNDPDIDDCDRYVLRAAALEKPKRMKVDYVKVDFVSDQEKAEAFLEGGLRYFTHGKVTGDLEHDTIPVTKLEQMFSGNGIYRKVETEIDERQEFIDAAIELIDASKKTDGLLGAMFDSGKFKLVD